jgi:hypothetical protein
MASKKDKNKARTQPLRALQPNSRTRRAAILFGKALSSSWKAIVFVLFLLGAWRTLAYFLPDVSIQPKEVLNPSDPYVVPFEITNDGVVTLYNVATWCRFPQQVHYDAGSAYSAPNGHASDLTIANLTIVNQTAKELRPKEHTIATPCAFRSMLPKSVGGAHFDFENPSHEIEIGVAYRPEFFWFIERTFQAFVAVSDAKGGWHWYPAARSLTDEAPLFQKAG